MPIILAAIYLTFAGILGIKALTPIYHPPVPYSQSYWDLIKGGK